MAKELDELLKAFGDAGGDKGVFVNTDIAHLAASGHKILCTVRCIYFKIFVRIKHENKDG